MTGRVVDSLEISERFLWDLRQTISELVVENYAGRHARSWPTSTGCEFTIEAYGEPVRPSPLRRARPTSRWASSGRGRAARSRPAASMASAAHVYGKPIVGAEAFTADRPGTLAASIRRRSRRWATGRSARASTASCSTATRCSRGSTSRPGMTMGPWGLHYERTQTWWEQSKPWHEYLARCQFLLRQGRFVADICYLQAEGAPRRSGPPTARSASHGLRLRRLHAPRWCSTRMTVRGRPARAARRHELPRARLCRTRRHDDAGPAAQDQGTGRGRRDGRGPAPAPVAEPERTIRTATRRQVAADARGRPREVKEHRWTWPCRLPSTRESSAKRVCGPTSTPSRRSPLHPPRLTTTSELYFVANPLPAQVDRRSVASFRVTGRQPELWWPDTGRIEAGRRLTERRKGADERASFRSIPAARSSSSSARGPIAPIPCVAADRNDRRLLHARRPRPIEDRRAEGCLRCPR